LQFSNFLFSAAGAASTEFRQGPVAIVANDNDCRSLLGYGVFVTVNNICIASSLDAAGTDTSAYTCAVSKNNEFLSIVYHQYIAPSDSFFNCCQYTNVTPLVKCIF
jgi:hypothetical protein